MDWAGDIWHSVPPSRDSHPTRPARVGHACQARGTRSLAADMVTRKLAKDCSRSRAGRIYSRVQEPPSKRQGHSSHWLDSRDSNSARLWRTYATRFWAHEYEPIRDAFQGFINYTIAEPFPGRQYLSTNVCIFCDWSLPFVL